MAALASKHMSQVEYRPVVWDDLDDIVEEFDNTWGIHNPLRSDAISKLVSRHFVLHYLMPSTRGEIAQISGRFMGVTLSRVPGEPVMFPQARHALEMIEEELASTSEGYGELKSLLHWHEVECDMERRCSIDSGHWAELELFLVASAARGHGVGGKLWRRVVDDFARHDMPRYFLHTDSSCDVGFYDYQGLHCVMARPSDDHPEDLRLGGRRLDDLFIYASAPEAILESAHAALDRDGSMNDMMNQVMTKNQRRR